jgi:cell division inhibitor SulA
MLSLKSNNINQINTAKLVAVNDSTQWLSIKDVRSKKELTNQYSHIYKQNHEKNKWILMINPENNSLENIENISDKTFPKILQVSSNKVNVRLENIETALKKGNCSAVIINNALFSEAELSKLYISARQGNTQCFIFNIQSI